MKQLRHRAHLVAAAALVGAIAFVASAGCGADYVYGKAGGSPKRPGVGPGCGTGAGECPCKSILAPDDGFCGECPSNPAGECIYCPRDSFCNADPCNDTCPTAADAVPTDCPSDAPIACAGNFCCPRDFPVCCGRGTVCAVDLNGCEESVQ